MSSGSTGLPKAIIKTNRNWLTALASLQHKELCSLTEEEIFLSNNFCHSCGQKSLFACLYSGAQLAIVGIQEKHQDTFAYIHKYKITSGFLVVTQLNHLVKNYEKYDKHYLKSFQNLLTGGSYLSIELHKKLIDRYGFTKFRNGYGMSEMDWTTLVYFSDSKNFNNYGTIGKIVAGFEAKVIDDNENGLPANKHGQMCFRSDAITPGYLNNDIENEKLFTKDGFIKTGDYGYYDDQEYFYIISRIKEIISVEGVAVYPAELEQLLLQNENIENAAVIGIEDEERGEIPIGFVKMVKGSKITAQEIQNFVDDRVNYYKKLRGAVKIVDSFPLNSLNKIYKPALKHMVLQF